MSDGPPSFHGSLRPQPLSAYTILFSTTDFQFHVPLALFFRFLVLDGILQLSYRIQFSLKIQLQICENVIIIDNIRIRLGHGRRLRASFVTFQILQ